MSVVIDSGEVNCVCGCVMGFMMFLVYFWDNSHDIITLHAHAQDCVAKVTWLTNVCADPNNESGSIAFFGCISN